MSQQSLYRVIFQNQDKIYEMYARNVEHGAMFGFVEIEKIVFGEKTSVVVDPSEENLKTEFKHVKRTYIPLHAIIRIDEVDRQGTAKITSAGDYQGNVATFPVYTQSGDKDRG